MYSFVRQPRWHTHKPRYNHTSTQAHKHISIQSTQTHRRTGTQAHRDACMQAYECRSTEVRKQTSTQAHQLCKHTSTSGIQVCDARFFVQSSFPPFPHIYIPALSCRTAVVAVSCLPISGDCREMPVEQWSLDEPMDTVEGP